MDLFFGLVSFFLCFFNYSLIFLIFNNILKFILITSFPFLLPSLFLPSFLPPSLPPSLSLFLSFFHFLPFFLSCVAHRLLVLQLGVRPEPLRWESRVQDIGPPETSQAHVISNSESSPRDLCFNAKTQLHSTTSKLQCWTPHAKQLARQEHNPPISREAAENHSKFTNTPNHTTRCGPAHQKEMIQPHPPEHRHQSPPPGSLHNPLNQPHPLGAHTKNNGNYKRAACEKETPNTGN